MTYSELRGGEADVDIETPHAAVRPHKNGRYEIETRVGETVIQVRKGEAEVFTSQGSETVNKGRMVVVREGPGGLQVRVADDEPRGDWDRWNEDRDDRLSDVESYRYVSSSVVGAGDLDGHGDWRYVSGYGYCWYPRVAVGWAPYRHGRWTWAPYYGWTWVGYEPWGWAPYHYGRWWNHPSYGWGWYPGDRYYYQPWRPALVSFFGWGGRGGGWSVGIGFGNVGWVPLAPGEIYHPWYGRRGYGGRNQTIIVDNSVNIYNDYRNARVNNGVTVVDADGFSRGRLDNVRSLSRNELATASAVRGDVPVVPERQAQGSLLRNIRTSASNGQPGDARRTTFSRTGVRESASPRRASFDEQRQQVAASVREIRTQGAVNRPRADAAVTQPTTRNSPRVSGSVRSAGDVRSNSRADVASPRTGAVSPRDSQTFSAPDRRDSGRLEPRNNSVDRGSSVRGSRATTSAPVRGDSDARPTDRGTLQQRNNPIDNGPVFRESRSPRTSSAPERSQSRVDRSDSSRSAPQVDRGSPRSGSRVGRSESSPGRIPRTVDSPSPARSRGPEMRSSPSPSPRMSRQPSGDSSPRMSRPSAPSGPSPRASSPSPRSSSPGISGGGSPRSSGGGIRGGSEGGRGSRR
jgi:hypothetical protein